MKPFTRTTAQTFYPESLAEGPFNPRDINFIPASDDLFISISSCDDLRVLNIDTASTVFICNACIEGGFYEHFVHPQDPFVIWFSDEDKIRQYDICERHRCHASNRENVILNLENNCGPFALHPIRSEVLAVGIESSVRLYDRRFSQNNSNS